MDTFRFHRLAGKLLHQFVDNIRMQLRFTLVCRPDRSDKVGWGNVFQQVTRCSGFDSREDLIVFREAGQDDNFRCCICCVDLAGCFYAVHLGHDKVHQNDIGLEEAHFLQSF